MAADPDALLEVGYVSRAHSIHGEVAVKTFDPSSEAIFEVERITLTTRAGETRTYEIEDCRPTPKDLVLALEGVNTRTQAEALVGAKVEVSRAELPLPEPGEYFQDDLIGLTAVDEKGATLGKVEEIWNTGPVPNLVIRQGTQELLVPFADEFVPEVDLEQKKLVVRPPELTD